MEATWSSTSFVTWTPFLLLTILSAHKVSAQISCSNSTEAQQQIAFATLRHIPLVPLSYTIEGNAGSSSWNILYRFWSAGHGTVYAKWYRGEELISINTTALVDGTTVPDGVISLRVPTQPSGRNELMFQDRDLFYTVRPPPLPSSGENETVCLPLPTVNVHPGCDLVYEPNRNISVQITTSLEEDLSVCASMISLETGEFVDCSNAELEIVTISEPSVTADAKIYEVQLATSIYPTGGFLLVTTSITQMSSLASIDVGRRIAFHSTRQSGPFPLGYLNFLHDDRWISQGPPSDRREYQLCDLRDLFTHGCGGVGCTVVGDRNIDLQLLTMNSFSNSLEKIASVQEIHPWASPYYHQAYVLIQDLATNSKGNQVVCKARNELGKEVIKSIDVVYFTSLAFKKDATRLTRLDPSTLQASCTVEGYPEAEILFWLDIEVLKKTVNNDSFITVRNQKQFTFPQELTTTGTALTATIAPTMRFDIGGRWKVLISRVLCVATQSLAEIESFRYEIKHEMVVPHEWLFS